MSSTQGYLLVLRQPEILPTNPRYRGIDRMPPYPSDIMEEQGALDDYVFGHYKNKEGVIPSLELARDLLSRFASSPRQFEIIHVRTAGPTMSPPMDTPGYRFLGVDVAGDAPFWSIVGDLPNEPAAVALQAGLNQYGLLHSLEDAQAYLDAYISHWADYVHGPLKFWEVYLIE